ncbi:MAG: AAA family ATPase [Desulfobacterales bacterium]|nr:AAA family ATPase [Desulfobacterales bacterium]MBS3755532.1 AAA family ATPase [Desulfobacterales bacterium]
MLKDSLISRDPLKIIGEQAAGTIENGGFAAILARAGVGKTALLVQLAIYAMLNDKNILHISTENPVDKVNLWHREVFYRLTQSDATPQTEKLWNQLLHNRFIMTFETESFNVDKLEKRISELMASEIFRPQQIMIDGFTFADENDTRLDGLKNFAREHQLIFWFTVRTHRDDPVAPSGIPNSFVPFSGLFDLMLQLHPDKNRVYLKKVPGETAAEAESNSELYLDPSTMLISDAPV